MISVVIPAFNEGESVAELFAELTRVAQSAEQEFEFLFIDDGSTDATWSEINRLARQDERVRGIALRRQFGKAAALSAGFKAARGSIIFTMDGDLQDDPKEFPRFLQKMEKGLDVVSGWKKVRHDPWHKVWPSRVFNWLVSRLTGVKLHDHNCGYKCYRRGVFDDVHLYGELHRFVPVLAASYGWRVGEIEVDHRPRQHGRSKYGWGRIPKGFLDLITVWLLVGYRQRPQHALGMIGLFVFAAGAIGMLVLTAAWFLTRIVVTWEPIHLHQRAVFFYSLGAVLLGSQFMAIGFLAALITATHNRQQTNYAIRETTDDDLSEDTSHIVGKPHLRFGSGSTRQASQDR